MTTRLVILGAGGLAREFHDIVEAANAHEQQHGRPALWDFLGFIDANAHDDARVTGRAPVLGGDAVLATLPSGTAFIVAIADTDVRRRVAADAESHGLTPAVVVHPRALVGARGVALGGGTVVAANAIITTDVAVGKHVHIDRGVHVGHDCVLADFVSLYPAAAIAGAVQIDLGATVGSNATVIQGLRIGADAFVGAGAVVVRDVAASTTVVGVPAKPVAS